MKYLEDFITDCTARGLARTTTVTYRCNVRDFLDHIDKDPTEIHDSRGSLNKKFTTHCFRHFFTTHLRRSGMPRELIQELRGDRRGDAIDIYDHIDPEELRRSYLQHVPRFGQVDRCQATLTEMI